MNDTMHAGALLALTKGGVLMRSVNLGNRDADEPEAALLLLATAAQEEPSRPSSDWRNWARRGFTNALVGSIRALRDAGVDTSTILECMRPLAAWGIDALQTRAFPAARKSLG